MLSFQRLAKSPFMDIIQAPTAFAPEAPIVSCRVSPAILVSLLWLWTWRLSDGVPFNNIVLRASRIRSEQ